MVSPEDILKRYWGYTAFRPLQEVIIRQVIAGKDVLALLPTGGGKSLCYQVPALVFDGLTIVVSPLIALMKDQVSRLDSLGINAAAIYSGMRPRDIDRILDNARFGKMKLLYVSPERIKTNLFKERLPQLPVSLIAIDEAHCISQWGHDFRPAYLELGQLKELFPHVPMLALTASATDEVKMEIVEKLGLHTPEIVRDSFARSNLRYHVIYREDQLPYMERLLQKQTGSAIVYMRHRRKCAELADWLNIRSISAASYHGGMAMADRDRVQGEWISNKKRVIVATNAFGMGVDKGDVRLVLHYDLPPSLEEYYQEAGRAGRDGVESWCIMVVRKASEQDLVKRIESSFPSFDEIRRVYVALHLYLDLATGSGAGETFGFDLDAFASRFNMRPGEAYTALDILARDGWIQLDENVFRGNTLQIVADKESLYASQVADKELDQLVRALLRGYEGLWSTPVAIHEKRIAGFLQWKESDVIKRLVRMHALGLVDYRRLEGNQQITLLRERVPEKYFTIDLKAYNFRKERALDRMHAMLAYLKDDVDCREAAIRRYFGESDVVTCGHCDRCVARRTKPMSQAKGLLYDLSDRDGITIKDFLENYPVSEQESIRKDLRRLADERKIRIVEDKIYRI